MTESGHPSKHSARPGSKQLSFALIGVALLTILLQIPWNPNSVPLSTDSGFFIYSGEQLLGGARLYADIWDHKPPGIHWINALFLSLGTHSIWTLWAANAFWVALCVSITFLATWRAFGHLPALATGLILSFSLHHPSYYEGGNLTELYALLPDALILLSFSSGLFRPSRLYPAVIGASLALAFLFKPNLTVLGIVALTVLLARDWRSYQGRNLGAMLLVALLGSLAIILPAALVLLKQGVLPDMLQAVFISNVGYAQEGFSFTAIYTTLRRLLVEQPMVALTGWSLVSAGFLLESTPFASKMNRLLEGRQLPSSTMLSGGQAWFLAGILIAIPLQVAAFAVIGRNFGHYYLTPLLTMSVAAGGLVFVIQTRMQVTAANIKPFELSAAVLLLTLLAGWGLEVAAKTLPRPGEIAQFTQGIRSGAVQLPDLNDFILENSQPGDPILVWGTNASVYFFTDREPPSAHLYANRLLEANLQSAQRFEEFMDDLEARPPLLIFASERSPDGIPYFAGDLNRECRGCGVEVRRRISRLKDFVDHRYAQLDPVGEWSVFRLEP